MAKRHHTIILIPHAHAKLRQWQVTNLLVGIAAGAFFLLTLAASLFLWLHFSKNVNPIEIARLKSENEQLRRTNLTFEAGVKKLQDQLSQYEERTRQLAIVAGVEGLESGAEAGVGGGTPLDEAGASGLPALESRASHLAGALHTVASKLNERVSWTSSTPAIAPVQAP